MYAELGDPVAMRSAASSTAGRTRTVVFVRLGLTAVSGRFYGGDVVELRGPDTTMVARGVVAYDATETRHHDGSLDLRAARRAEPARGARRRPGRARADLGRTSWLPRIRRGFHKG
jgi:hypothetical protein